MVEQENDQSDAKPNSKMYFRSRQALATALRRLSGVPNQSPLRPVYCLFSLAIVAVILVLRYAAFLSPVPAAGAGVFSLYAFSGYHAAGGSPDSSVLDSATLLKLAESNVGEDDLRREIALLLEGNLAKLSRSTPFLTWRRSLLPVDVHSSSFRTLYAKFRPLLSDWSDRRAHRRQPPGKTLTELVTLIGRKEKYSSCAVVGNSGILLNSEHGGAIDGHEAVIRLNNARIAGFSSDVGSKTTISFVNSNIVRLCARRRDCFCHPYGAAVPIVLYICQPIHFLDFAACNATTHANGRAPFLVTDPGFDTLCSKIVKYYSLEKWFGGEDGRNRTLQGWSTVHEGPFFHYSSGMQAVLTAVGVCEKVSLFGFGKAATAKHHYHTNQKAELQLHDYEAEYNFYKDLADRPHNIPFLSGAEFQFPPVEIYH